MMHINPLKDRNLSLYSDFDQNTEEAHSFPLSQANKVHLQNLLKVNITLKA